MKWEETIIIIQTIDSISFTMRERCDFSFLSNYGKVFCVFSQNDSGNISFGVMNKENRYFIKVAGAKTMESFRSEQEAVDALKDATALYVALKHPTLIELLEHYSFDNLYVAVFEWASGECLFDHWNFKEYAKNPLLQSPKSKFKNLSMEKKLTSIHSIFEFLSFVESKGYVAIDFYDGSIMYDFINNCTTICDIDFFRESPTVNDIGEDFWGTKRFKAPEEYILGKKIDSLTNVFTLGSLIFHLLGEYTSEDIQVMYKNNEFFPCRFENWELNRKLYDVTIKAINKDRTKRYKSISAFYTSWQENL